MLEWDSAFWGIPIARRIGGISTTEELAAVEAWCDHHAVRCLYVLAEPTDPGPPGSLASHGYCLTDERVSLLWYAASRPKTAPSQPPEGLIIRLSAPDDIPALQGIAAESHTDTRFFADNRFPRDQARALYARWIAESCTGFADAVLVATMNGTVAGYCSCHRPATAAAPGSIGLIAVAPAARGLGVGRALVLRSLDWFTGQGATHVSVVTQGRNEAAMRLYQSCGFVVERRQHWYHRWFAEQVDEAS
jgi:ribosomal protein S18 acetylase RimI-like enzyme